ncbi:odorant receptor 22c-like [Odontomachus brunneus]|uniref:odorant receptor 22c-like n=1 Tax=Odontomachus brunneus TaxID=486640 RepID=UPI0013F1D98A|nr:odorant receptor 22c-like [Odontomachus brunneus]
MIPTSTVSQQAKIGLQLTGVWPNSSVLFKLLWTSIMIIALIFQYRYVLYHFNTDDLPHLIDGLSTTVPYSLLFFKLIVLWIKNRVFIDILTAMSKDWRECSSMHVMIDKATLSHRCSKLIIGIYSTAVLLYSTASIDFRKNIDVCRELLVKMELPFVFCESPTYEIVMFVQFIHLMAVSLIIGTIDTLIVTLMLHIGGQIDIILQQLNKIYPKDGEYGLPTGTAKSLIIKHYKIIDFSDSIENLFSLIALMQFLSSIVIMCCIGFLVICTLGTDDGIRMLIKTFFFYIAMTMESFIFCFAGEYLSNKSKTVGDAAYESLWYVLKPQDSRMLLLMIMRSQRRLTITAGKFMDLSLQGFMNSLKASASYISVLYAMY